MKYAGYALASLFLWAGCAIGPRFRTPEMTVPESYRDYEGPAAKASLADLPWWEVFKDESLTALLETSLKDNYDRRIAAARIEEAKALYGSTRSDLFPKVYYTAEASQNRNSQDMKPTAERLSSVYGGGFGAYWEADVWGKLRRATEAAKAEYLASQEARKAVILSLVSEVAQAYFNLRELDLELDIATRTRESRQATVKLFNERLQGGVASRLETAQAEADLAETAAAVPNLNRQISIQENFISYLLGSNPKAIDRGKVLSEQYLPPELPAGLPLDLLTRRPDILQSEKILKAANAQVGVKMGEMLPRFVFKPFVGNQSDEFDNAWESTKAYTWSMGGTMTQPLFESGNRIYQVKGAKARWDQAKMDYEKTVLNAFREVTDALAEVRQYALILTEQEKQVKAYQEAAQISKQRYEQGLSSYLEVLDADRRLYGAETQLAKTRGQQMNAFVRLYKTLGGGWEARNN